MADHRSGEFPAQSGPPTQKPMSFPSATALPRAEGFSLPGSASLRAAERERAPRPLDGLLERCAAGDRAACHELFLSYRAQVSRQVAHLTRLQAEVEDIVQEVFSEVFRSLPGFQGRSSFATWLYRITARASYRYLKRRGPRILPPELRSEAADSSQDPGRDSETRERHVRALAILERLSPKKRLVLTLHDLEGRDAAEIASLVGAPLLTVRTRLFYARREFAAAARRDPVLAEYFQNSEGPEGGGDR
jgi:RNA polymerase sigma-70 factor (ECF subfamily)